MHVANHSHLITVYRGAVLNPRGTIPNARPLIRMVRGISEPHAYAGFNLDKPFSERRLSPRFVS